MKTGPRIVDTEREYRKFTLGVAAVLTLLAWLFTWRKWLPVPVAVTVTAVLMLVAAAATAWPRFFRTFYLRGMVANHWIGLRAQRVFLSVFFFLVMCPVGLLLRLAGHDPLALKLNRAGGSYWVPARKRGNFDRMF